MDFLNPAPSSLSPCFLCLSSLPQQGPELTENSPRNILDGGKSGNETLLSYLLHSCESTESESNDNHNHPEDLINKLLTQGSFSFLCCGNCQDNVATILQLHQELETAQTNLLRKLNQLRRVILENSINQSLVNSNPNLRLQNNEWLDTVTTFQRNVREAGEFLAEPWFHNQKCHIQTQNFENLQTHEDDDPDPAVKVETVFEDYKNQHQDEEEEPEEDYFYFNDDHHSDADEDEDLPETKPEPELSSPSPPQARTMPASKSKRKRKLKPSLSRDLKSLELATTATPDSTSNRQLRKRCKITKDDNVSENVSRAIKSSPKKVRTLTLTKMRKTCKRLAGKRNVYTYKCDLCPKFSAASTYTLIQHLRGHELETGQKLFHCEEPDCGESFSNKQFFEYHSAQHHDPWMQWHCKVCDHDVAPSRLVSHMKRHVENGDKMWTTKEGSRARGKKVEIELFPCPHCYQCSPSLKDFVKHLHMHPRVTYQCDFCDHPEFPRGCIYQWAEHLRDVHGRHEIFQWSCQFCNKRYIYKDHLTVHVSKNHQANHCCDICNKTFGSASSLKVHQQSVHLKAKIVPCDHDQPCSESFESKVEMIKHKILVHGHPPFKCDNCPDLDFLTANYLKKHQRIHHSGTVFHCSTCAKVFSSEERLKSHETIHGERMHICDQCGFAGTSKHRLAAHLVIHNDVARHPCPHCPKRFNYKRALDNHIRTHTKEKPFVCHYCSRPFSVKQSLTNHVKNVHEKNR